MVEDDSAAGAAAGLCAPCEIRIHEDVYVVIFRDRLIAPGELVDKTMMRLEVSRGPLRLEERGLVGPRELSAAQSSFELKLRSILSAER